LVRTVPVFSKVRSLWGMLIIFSILWKKWFHSKNRFKSNKCEKKYGQIKFL
jgi:hypothetical protein